MNKTIGLFKTLMPFLLSAFVLLITGCDYDTNQSALDPKGPVAQNQYDVFMLSVYITIFLFVTVGGALAYVLIRFREKPGDENKPLPEQSHGNPLIEVGLIFASTIVLVILAVPTLKGIVLLNEVPEELEEEAITINVRGFQWWWAFEYPDLGITTANEIVIPTGKAVKINLESNDVIHSFWIPKLAGKMDLMPGQKNFMWFLADEPGEYWGQCAEYCGESHAYMLFRAFAKEQGEFDAWVKNQKKAPKKVAEIQGLSKEDKLLAAHGEELFGKVGCIQCHTIGEAGGLIAPNLSKFGGRTTLGAAWKDNTTENLKEWIAHSDHVKPGNLMYKRVDEMKLSDEDVNALTAYLQTLK